jgi:hypothetical protein
MLLNHQTIAVPHRPHCSPCCARRPALGIGQRGSEKDSAESRADRAARSRTPPGPDRREHVHQHPVPYRAHCRSLQVGPVQIQEPSVLPRVGHTGHLASSAGGTQAGSTGPCPPVREELTTWRPPRTQRRTYGPPPKRDTICSISSKGQRGTGRTACPAAGPDLPGKQRRKPALSVFAITFGGRLERTTH